MWEVIAVVIILIIMVNAIVGSMTYKRPVVIRKVVIPPQYRRVTKAEICEGCGATLHYGNIVWDDCDTVLCVYCGRPTLPTDVQWMVRQWSLTRER